MVWSISLAPDKSVDDTYRDPEIYVHTYRAIQHNSILIPYPPLQEQQRIVAILDEAFAGIATATANAEHNLANARELFESYLHSVFENKAEDWEEKKSKPDCRKFG
jgi:type I restriction enzyme, S subunit